MVSIQYVGDSHTSVLIPGEFVKRKVVNGEIIEVEDANTVSSLLSRGFALATSKPAKTVKVEVEDDGKDEVTVEVASKKKSK